jgi:integrase
MARRPTKPWWWAERGCWVVQVGGKRHVLASGRKARADAVRAMHALLGKAKGEEAEAEASPVEAPPAPAFLSVAAIATRYLARPAGELGAEARRVHARYLKEFGATFGERPASTLDPKEVVAWVDARAGRWGEAMRAAVLGVLKSVLGWAWREGLLEANPLARMRGRSIPSRQVRLTAEQFAAVLDATPDQEFKDFVIVLLQTGARPGELGRATAADYDRENRRLVLKDHKTAKKTGKPRLIYLPPEAVAVVERLVLKWPAGPIFKNTHNNPWTAKAAGHRFRALRERLGLPKYGGAYAARHLVATELLVAEVPPAKVAALLGHASTTMLYRHYSSLVENVEAMHDALGRRGKGGPPAPPDPDAPAPGDPPA